MKYSILISVFTFLIVIVGCEKDNLVNHSTGQYGIFQVENDGITAVINGGVINSNTLKNLKKMLEDNPSIKTINLKDAPGSEDDETNVLVGREIFKNGINTHLLDGAEIASGAVDLFLAGRNRTTASGNFKIGVHSWSDGSKEATDYPEDAEAHNLFLAYYEAIGYTDEWSKEFYFYTIRSAKASDIHWMTNAEIEKYGMLT